MKLRFFVTLQDADHTVFKFVVNGVESGVVAMMTEDFKKFVDIINAGISMKQKDIETVYMPNPGITEEPKT